MTTRAHEAAESCNDERLVEPPHKLRTVFSASGLNDEYPYAQMAFEIAK